MKLPFIVAYTAICAFAWVALQRVEIVPAYSETDCAQYYGALQLTKVTRKPFARYVDCVYAW